MNLFIHIFIFITFSLYSAAQGDPRCIKLTPSYVPKENPHAQDTTKSIVIYGATDGKGLYSVNGVNRPLTFIELEKLLPIFYRDFPKEAISDTVGYQGLDIPKPNILYSSNSWAELKNDGRNLVTKIAKNNQVSLYYFSANLNSPIDKQIISPNRVGAFIDYYDNRLTITAASLWPKKHKLKLATKDFSNELNQLWKDGKITPEQPFKAKVVAAGGMSPWSGYIVIYLQEIDGEKRFLEAKVAIAYSTGVTYKNLSHKRYKQILERLENNGSQDSILFTDPMDVSRFVCSSPLGYVGAMFGEKDIVRSSYLRFLKAK
jgi:hypothetical protein